ncbi:hypothetical protein [Enterobacter soli]|uniref:hypothetical protein n=1 Tax=Enterobacter soli TaxID=885040 RepID=UPI0034CF0CF6
MKIFVICLSFFLGCYALIDSYTSYKKGVFKEYRKMAPYVYHYRGEKSFIPQILMNALMAVIMLGVGVWLLLG